MGSDAGVVGVWVRQHQRGKLLALEAEALQVPIEALRKAGQPGVDRKQPPAFLDQVPVDQLAAQRVDALADLVWHLRAHLRSPPRQASRTARSRPCGGT